MRVQIVYILCVILLGGLIGTLMMIDPGYMMISYGSVTIEASLWAGMFVIVGILALAWVVGRLAGAAFRSAGGLNAWNRRRLARGARDQTVQGVIAATEGDWAHARRALSSSATRSDMPFVNYLNAARAAHALGDTAERDAHLKSARESAPGSDLAIGLTLAELQLSAGEWKQCLATLSELREHAPRHPSVLKMSASAHVGLQDWDAVIDLLPALEKARALDAEELAALQRKTWLAKIAAVLSAKLDAPGVDAVWKQVPRQLRRDEGWVLDFAKLAAEDGAPAQAHAETALRDCLSRSWSDALAAQYGRVQGDDVAKQLSYAERWLRARADDAVLLLTLGRLAMREHLWAKAREYFEASLEAERGAEAAAELGRLYAALGNYEAAAKHLEGAFDAPLSLPSLPMPDRTTSLEAVEAS